jgi:hypothetical protein
MCDAEQRSCKRKRGDQFSSRSQSSREVRSKPGYQSFGQQVPDIFSQVDFMQVLTYRYVNTPDWGIAGLKASA